MASKIFLAVMALAVLTAFVFAEEEEYAVDDLLEFVKRGKGRNRGRGKMAPLTNADMEACEKFGQSCVCDNRLAHNDDRRYLICS